MNERFDRNSRYGQRDRQQFSPPVRVDEELDVKIEAVGEKGDGVAKKDGFVLFVPNVKEGDYVRVKVTKVLRKVGFAEVVGVATTPEPQESVRAPARETVQERADEPEEEFQPSEDDSEDFGEDGEEADEEPEADEVKEESDEPEESVDEPEADEVKEEADEPEESDEVKEEADEPEEADEVKEESDEPEESVDEPEDDEDKK